MQCQSDLTIAGRGDGQGGWYSMGEYSVNLMDKLGQGSYGVVYRGKEKKSGKTIAIKQIKISQEGQGKKFIYTELSYVKSNEYTNCIGVLTHLEHQTLHFELSTYGEIQ